MTEGGKEIGRDRAGVKGEDESHCEKRERKQHEHKVAIVGAIDGISRRLEASEKKQNRSEDNRSKRELLGILLVFVTVLLTALGDAIFYRTMEQSRIDSAAALKASNLNAAKSLKGAHEDAFAALSKAHQDAADALTAANLSGAAALRAALAANGISQDTANKQLRPYVYTNSLAIQNFSVGKIPSWTLVYGVLGQTPAYNVQVSGFVAILPYPNPGFIDKMVSGPMDSSDNRDELFPNFPKQTPAVNHRCASVSGVVIESCALTEEMFNGVQSGNLARMYFIGKVNYEDAFGARHVTPICYDYSPVSAMKFGVEVCRKHKTAT